jgi:3-methyladenine DNA glycosylase AlkD
MTDVVTVRSRARRILRAHRASSDAEVLAIALKVYKSGHRQLAYELLRAAPRGLAAASRADVRKFAVGMASWGEVDCFACFVGGVAWRTGRISQKEIALFAASRNRWWRRAALVSTVPLNAKSRGATSATGDAARTLAVCATLLDDRDDMVIKAMSWALRELAKRDPSSVRQFLDAHGDRVAARVRREVTNKLTTGRKSARSAQAGTSK